MLGELTGVAKFFWVTGYTNMRKSIYGLMTIVRDTYELDPYNNSLSLFYGRGGCRAACYFDDMCFGTFV